MISALKKYRRTEASERKLFLETLIISFIIRLIIKFMPMKKYVDKLGKENKLSENIDANEIETLKKFVVNVKRVSRNSFWRTKCYEEAFTLKKILEKRGYSSTIYFGVLKEENNELKAHAWLKIGDVILIGGNAHNKYTVTKFFT